MTTPVETNSDENHHRVTSTAIVRSVYRDSEGRLHHDWPEYRIEEALRDPGGMIWVDILDPGSADNRGVESLLTEVFHFHPLAVEDALKDSHIPRIDDWNDHLYVVFSTIDFDPVTDDLRLHELDIFLGANYLVTYHNERLPLIDSHRKNIVRDGDARLRHGPDHLLYRILDEGVSEFLPAIQHLDETIDEAQDEVFQNPSRETLQNIFRVKHAALRIHRIISPLREVLNKLARDTYEPIAEAHRVYFRDVYDHLVLIHDITEVLRDLVSGALETYLSAVSNRTNDIMKFLTMVTVLFLPLSFLSGFFGMNFFGETMAITAPLPRVAIFLLTIITMIATPVAIGIWVRRKGWL